MAIGQKNDEVREFGCYTHDLQGLCHWQKEKSVYTVALESTGSYWQSLFVVLQDYGLKPILDNGKFS